MLSNPFYATRCFPKIRNGLRGSRILNSSPSGSLRPAECHLEDNCCLPWPWRDTYPDPSPCPGDRTSAMSSSESPLFHHITTDYRLDRGCIMWSPTGTQYLDSVRRYLWLSWRTMSGDRVTGVHQSVFVLHMYTDRYKEWNVKNIKNIFNSLFLLSSS